MTALPFRRQDERLAAVQILRGVAVLLVILVHSINVADYRVINRIESESGWIANFRSINEFGACGVDLFFVISGFVMGLVIQRTESSWSVFARERFNRIAPLYWLATGGYVLLLLSLRIPFPEGWLATSFFILPGFHYVTPILVVGWSLAYELAFYSLVMLVMLCQRTRRLGALIVLVFGLAAAGQWLKPLDGIAAVYLNPILAEFGVGLLCYWLWKNVQGVPRQEAIISTITGAALLGATCFVGFEFPTWHMSVLNGETGAERTGVWALSWAVILLGSLWLTSESRQRGGGMKILRLIGNASYSLYLVHMFPCTFAERVVPAQLIPPDVLVIVTAAGAVALGLGVHVWIEQPLLRVLQQRPEQAKASVAVDRHIA